ncbi:MAG TPA: UDP-N-acetylmuramoyl-L-alanyl-D-glutamate--2,6-diaminopimelate ligase [Gammaproteobacteria bacterium]|nr:UDP-N-acetylmuramoyl-L-alanyl-D-glutamate--2,6-diaminopimelate ligase [Gammaproteobacteria bacterium]
MNALARSLDGVSLAEVLGADAPTAAGEDRALLGITTHSGAVRAGYLFLAVRGRQHHGLEYCADVIRRGAVAIAYDPAGAEPYLTALKGIPAFAIRELGQRAGVLAARFHGDPSATQQVMAVTGTNGKTSVSLITAQTLHELSHPCGILGTVGYGLHGKLSTPSHTTPDAVEVQAWLAQFRVQGARHVSMEASSHALEQGRLAGTHVHTAVFTNLTRDHLDYHGDMHAYGEAKRRLFGMPGLKHAIINLDDAFGLELATTLPSGVALTGYSLAGATLAGARMLQAQALELHAGGMHFDVSGDFGTGHVDSRLLGHFNAANLLAVLGALLAFDFPFADALHALSRARTVPGRMECFGGGARQPLVVVDYAHTPDALEKALLATRAHCRGRLWCVFGCGGDRDRGKRPQMGHIADRHADRVVLTDDNPRTEDGDAIIKDILAGIESRAHVSVQRERAQAVASAVHAAAPGDAVLVAGKGHEEYQIVDGESLPYSDRATVSALLREADA